MKLNREQLKELIKECLAEILTEGLGGQLGKQSQLTETKSKVVNPQKRHITSDQRQASNYRNAIKYNSGGDPVLESILADTAKTTLVNQVSAGDSISPVSAGPQPHKLAQHEQFVGSPEQVFGEDVSSRWANLAFADPPGKKLV